MPNIVTKTIAKHIDIAQHYPVACFLVLLSFAWVIYIGYTTHQLLHGIGYIFAVWFGAFVTDIITGIKPKDATGFPIKRPVNRELLVIIICTLLGLSMLFIRFVTDWNTLNKFTRLALLPLFLFVFPIVLSLIYLFRYKYKPKELGINLHYWYLPIFIHIIVGGITLWLAPEVSHWKEAYKEYGLLGMSFTGLISAALPEEFLRMLLQTRLGKAMNNMGLGFVLATIIWASMHIPVFGQDFKTNGWSGAIGGAARIVPIGLLWGYVTHRTKSLIPAVLIHGFNLWGLQNM